MLLVRPAPVVAEALPDYAGRLADANGLPRGWELFRALADGANDDRVVVGMLPVARPVEIADSHLAVTSTSVVWRGITYPRFEFLQTTAPVCPRCLAIDGVRPIYWRSRRAVCCGKHGVRLLGQCPSCGDELSPISGTATRCACGFDLRTVEAEPVPPKMGAFQSVLDAAFVAGAGALPAREDHPAWSLLSSPGGLATLQWLLRTLPGLPIQSRQSTASRLPERFLEVEALERILRRGAPGLDEHLIVAWTRYYQLGSQGDAKAASSLGNRLRGLHDAFQRLSGDSETVGRVRAIHMGARDLCAGGHRPSETAEIEIDDLAVLPLAHGDGGEKRKRLRRSSRPAERCQPTS